MNPVILIALEIVQGLLPIIQRAQEQRRDITRAELESIFSAFNLNISGLQTLIDEKRAEAGIPVLTRKA